METKICKKCGEEKELSFFKIIKKGDKSYINGSCKKCSNAAHRIRSARYYAKNKNQCNERYRIKLNNNKEEIAKKQADYFQKNKDKIYLYKKEYRLKNKEKINQDLKQYRENHKEELKIKKHLYYINNKDKIKEKVKLYTENNKEKVLAYRKKYFETREKNDLSFKLKKRISCSIRSYLKNNNSVKKGSCLDYLFYSIAELKEHLEKQFEPWMTWNNWGLYDKNTWNDQDQSTWAWQLDHIIPQSDLPYTSMEDENFKKCWALENLRPLNAKQNLIEGTNRLRHKKEEK